MTMGASLEINKNKNSAKVQGNRDTTTHIDPFECVWPYCFLPTLVGEADDADGDALRRAWFVRLEEEVEHQCRDRARCQVPTPVRTRRLEMGASKLHGGCV